MNIDLSKVTEKTGNGVTYMKPGIKDVEIVSFEEFTAQNGNVSVIGTFVDINTGAEHREFFPCGEDIKAGKTKSPFDISLIKLRHIARAAVEDSVLEKLVGSDLDTFIGNLNDYLVGAKYRQKFTGEEKKSMNTGNIYAVARIPLPVSNSPMAESLGIPMANTQLRYNQNDPKDYKVYVEAGLENDFIMPQGNFFAK